MAKDAITVPEWQRALSELFQEAEGFAARDAARAWGVSMDTARQRIRRMIDAGKARVIGHKHVVGIDGIRRPVPAYALTERRKKT